MSTRRRAARVASVALVVGLSACGEPTLRTQIVAIVDSDLAVPDELDSIAIEVEPVQASAAAAVDLREHGLPSSLGLLHVGGPLGPIEVVAFGRLGEAQVVERRAIVSFVQDQTLELRLPLTRACAERRPPCKNETTCDQGTCVPAEQPELPVFGGELASFAEDAGHPVDP